MVDRLSGALLAATLLGAVAPLAAQAPAQPCGTTGESSLCAIARAGATVLGAQIVTLAAGGAPDLAVGGEGGLRLGVLPRVTGSVRIGAASIRRPFRGDRIRADRSPRMASSGTVAVRVLEGFAAAPTVAGIGAVDLLGTAALVPAISGGGTLLGWGGGVRVGLLRESFTTPAASLSVSYRRFREISTGESGGADDLSLVATPAAWSTRALMGKGVGGVGIFGGIAHDRISGDQEDFAWVDRAAGDPAGEIGRAAPTGRWSVFAGLSRALLLGSIGGEIGWASGIDRPDGFPAGSGFDPARGSWFGSLGARLAL